MLNSMQTHTYRCPYKSGIQETRCGLICVCSEFNSAAKYVHVLETCIGEIWGAVCQFCLHVLLKFMTGSLMIGYSSVIGN